MACAEQIKYCYEESDGLFFMSLQGDKYGYMPIPKFIKKSLIDEKKNHFDSQVSEIFSKWYFLDDNSVPPQYVLRPLLDKDDKDFWGTALPTLRSAFEGIAYDQSNSSDIVIHRSVTEWEVLYAMRLSVPRCKWFRRQFENQIDISYDQEKRVWDYCDFVSNPVVKKKYDNLISVMLKHIPVTNITDLNGPKLKSYIEKDNSFVSYLDTFKSKMMSTLSKELNDVVTKVQSWNRDGNGLGFSGEEIMEMIHHCKILDDKCVSFQGRKELLEESLQQIKKKHGDKLLDISFSIIGVSGSGKTALMSKIAEQCRSLFPTTPIIVRYCGTSKGSVDGLVLIRSICQQIQLAHNLPKLPIPADYSTAVVHFHQLLLTHPVVLFIDSLDQLKDTYLARSKLSFLVGVKCHPDTRIIVSTLPDDRDPITNTWGKYVYLCDTRLAHFKVPRVVVEPFKVGSEETASVLSGLMSLYNRKLTGDQTNKVLTSLSHEPTALYLTLAVNIVRHWTCLEGQIIGSAPPIRSDLKIGLRGTVNGLISQIFDQLESDYGKQLTRFALGFLTFSKSGEYISLV